MKGMEALDSGRGQVVIPVRPAAGGKAGAEQGGSKGFGHKDSILVGLGLILFLSFTWIYFVHRMYLNIEPTAPEAVQAVGATTTAASSG